MQQQVGVGRSDLILDRGPTSIDGRTEAVRPRGAHVAVVNMQKCPAVHASACPVGFRVLAGVADLEVVPAGTILPLFIWMRRLQRNPFLAV